MNLLNVSFHALLLVANGWMLYYYNYSYYSSPRIGLFEAPQAFPGIFLEIAQYRSMPGARKFLTYINHEIQTIYTCLALLVSLYYYIISKKARMGSYYINNKSLNSSATPGVFPPVLDRMFFVCYVLASMVGILFWSIYFYDASLILQPDSGYVI
jgi:hypothetical protein